MLTINGYKRRHCDGMTRRELLQIGAMGLGGLTLAELLQAEAMAGMKKSPKSIINIHLDGGPPQMDSIDPKPMAPAEIRGEFSPLPQTGPAFRFRNCSRKSPLLPTSSRLFAHSSAQQGVTMRFSVSLATAIKSWKPLEAAPQ